MNIKEAYNKWAEQYDTNENKTRDLEGISLRQMLANIRFNTCLEIGCGTGKNTEWLITKADKVAAIDFSEQMLTIAKSKIKSEKVKFIQADITKDWAFADEQFDLITFSLVLEHIENLNDIFQKLTTAAAARGYVYIGELHPFRQYGGSKARFETNEGLNIVTCFNHHVSDFTDAATENGFEILSISEYFDSDDRTSIPRIFTLLLRKR